MLSYTSNFERPLPDLPWMLIIGSSLFIYFAVVSLMELRLAQLGYHPTILDSKERWIAERSRVGKLGKRALVLIGASRIQLGIDLDTLRGETNMEPVQLAMDGSSFIPVLKNLAADPSVRGTVLVDYYPGALESALSDKYGAAEIFVNAYEKQVATSQSFTLAYVEKYLAESSQERLRSFADGATPLDSLIWRIIPNQKATKYLITRSDRSRLADYKLVSMPEFYYRRVIRHLDEEKSIIPTAKNIEQVLRHKIDNIKPHTNTAFIQGARFVRHLVTKIESRGGRVLFVAMPTSGMIMEIDNRRYPPASYSDLLKREEISLLNSLDHPTLRSFVCPDGSHLDFRDRSKFTSKLVRVLGLTSK